MRLKLENNFTRVQRYNETPSLTVEKNDHYGTRIKKDHMIIELKGLKGKEENGIFINISYEKGHDDTPNEMVLQSLL